MASCWNSALKDMYSELVLRDREHVSYQCYRRSGKVKIKLPERENAMYQIRVVRLNHSIQAK
jgi:hypothetical protein